jgi:hypothetical protein
VPLGEQTLTVPTRMLADPLAYQRTAVRRALDPADLRPRILLADAVGLGKTLEIAWKGQPPQLAASPTGETRQVPA